MKERQSNWTAAVMYATFVNLTFLVLYSSTQNLVGNIGITAGVGISTSGTLYMLSKINKT